MLFCASYVLALPLRNNDSNIALHIANLIEASSQRRNLIKIQILTGASSCGVNSF
jgi:hypothetical protein